MRYVINISPDVEKKILGLIKKGRAFGIDHFIEVAIRNQLLLEADDIKILQARNKRSKKKTQIREKFQKKYEITDFTKRDNLSVVPIQSKPANSQNPLIWGQIYRIFPIKFNIRVLANMLNNGGTTVRLEDFEETLFDLTFQLGTKLREIDGKMSRKRSGKLATGFPTDTYGKLMKSRDRYFAHYVGGSNKKSGSDGILAQLGLLKAFGDENTTPSIQITNLGLDFALSENPIIDQKEFQNSLTQKEIYQYINMVRENLPLELKLMAYFLSNVEEGINERETLNEKMREFYSSNCPETVKWESPRVVNTMRTGITSRMIELRLIDVQYVGQRAIYMLKKDDWREELK